MSHKHAAQQHQHHKKKDEKDEERPELKKSESGEGGEGGEGGGEGGEGGGESGKPRGVSQPEHERPEHARGKTIAVPKPGEQKSAVFTVGALSWTAHVHKAVNGYTHDGPKVLAELTRLEKTYGQRWADLQNAIDLQQDRIRDCTRELADAGFGEWLSNSWYKAVVVTIEAAKAYNSGSELIDQLIELHENSAPFIDSVHVLRHNPKIFFSPSPKKQAQAKKTARDFQDGSVRLINLFTTSKELGEELAKIRRDITVDEPPEDLAAADAHYQKALKAAPGQLRDQLIEAFDDKFKEVQQECIEAGVDPDARKELGEKEEKLKDSFRALKKTLVFLKRTKNIKELAALAKKSGLKFNPVKLTATIITNKTVADLAKDGAQVMRAWASENNHLAEEELSQAFAFLLVLNQQYVRCNHAYWSVKTYRKLIAEKLGLFLEPVKIDFPEADRKYRELQEAKFEKEVSRMNTRGRMDM